MFVSEGLFKISSNQLRHVLMCENIGLLVIGIVGNNLSGKRSVCRHALESVPIEFESRKLAEISCEPIGDFLRTIHQGGYVLMEDFDDLPDNHKVALVDYIMSVKLGIVECPENAVWVIPTSQHPSFADEVVLIPDLSSCAVTRRIVCEKLIDDFPCDPSCPVFNVLFHSSAKLSIGNLSALVRTAKLFALSADSPMLSCMHLSKSYHSLMLPCEAVSALSDSPYHDCCIIFRPSTCLADFIGLSGAQNETIKDYMDNPCGRCLLISGPIGSGKSHLAKAICSHSSIPTVCISSADILTARIGDSEKAFFRLLSNHPRLVIEDIDQLIGDQSNATGSVQRCLAVLVSYLDRWKGGDFGTSDRLIVATSRNAVEHKKLETVTLSSKLSFADKMKLIRSEFPQFPETTKPFDLIHLNNRAQCMLFAKDLKLAQLRIEIANNTLEK